jgi:hypothetical protein
MAKLNPTPSPSVAWVDQNGRPTQVFFEYLKSRERVGISNLSDVSTTAPTNNQVMIYNSTSGLWVPGAN